MTSACPATPEQLAALSAELAACQSDLRAVKFMNLAWGFGGGLVSLLAVGALFVLIESHISIPAHPPMQAQMDKWREQMHVTPAEVLEEIKGLRADLLPPVTEGE